MMKTGKSKIMIPLLIMGLVLLGILIFFQPGVMTAGDEPRNQTGDAETILQKRLEKAIVLYAESPIARVNNAEMQVDADNAGIVPYVSGGRVLVPLRFIAQNLQAEIAWEKETSAVTLTVGKDTVKLQPGQEQMQINGKSVKLDAVPEVIDGRTFVPIRAISEAFGKEVFYDRGLIVIGDEENPFDKESEKSLLDRLIAKVNNLPAVGSAENLLKLLTEADGNDYRKRIAADGGIAFDMAATGTEALNGVSQQQNTQNKAKVPAPAEQKQGKTESSAAVDYSKTNVQVQGVDEADLVKTDGEYLYHVNKQRVLITKAYPAAELQVVSTLTFAEKDFWPEELYLDEQYLVVIGRNNLYYDYILKPVPVVPQDDVQPDKDKNTINNTATAGIAPDEAQAGGQDKEAAAVQFERELALADVAPAVPRSAAKVISIRPPRLSRNEVKVFIFDIRDKTKITKVREVEIEGNYLTSRKIGSFLYFVANCPAYLYGYGQEENPNPVPFYRDTTLKNDYQAVPYEKIYYLPPVRSSNYLVIAGLDLNQREEGVQISTYLGAGDDVYVSQNNLYVALQNYNYGPIRIMALDETAAAGRAV
ncbi:MAG: beta-propeller domain-containing protein [Peptococcia bacterium]